MVITNLPSQSQNEEEFWSGEQLVAKYGSNKVIHANWPSFFMQEREQIHALIASLAVDGEIKALIMNQTVPGCNAAVDKLKSIRDDLFIVYCTPHDPAPEAAARANLLFTADELGTGPAIVKQAKKQGAKTFIHYSFPRHMAMAIYSVRRSLIQAACAAEGLRFVDVTVIDPTEDMYNAQQFIFDDVPKLASKHGEDTAFFCTNCFLQAPLIEAVVANHAIYPQPCCPSPYHGYIEAFDIETANGMPDLNHVIREIRDIAARENMSGRLSTWPVSVPMMLTRVGAEYAIKWINGQVPKTGIDGKVLMDCMKEYIRGASGEGIGVSMTSYTEGGRTYDTFKLVLMDYLDF